MTVVPGKQLGRIKADPGYVGQVLMNLCVNARDAMPHGGRLMITDVNGTILYVNPAFEKTSGYTRKEALGQNPRMLKSYKQDTEFYWQMWAVLSRGEVWSGHLINKRKDGTFYEENASISPVRDAAGRVINYVAVKRDVIRLAISKEWASRKWP